MNARIVAVGGASPAHRLPAAAVGKAWGRGGGRGQAAVCAPDEDTHKGTVMGALRVGPRGTTRGFAMGKHPSSYILNICARSNHFHPTFTVFSIMPTRLRITS